MKWFLLLFLEMEQVQPPEYDVSEMQNIVHMLQIVVNTLEAIVQQLMQQQQQ